MTETPDQIRARLRGSAARSDAAAELIAEADETVLDGADITVVDDAVAEWLTAENDDSEVVDAELVDDEPEDTRTEQQKAADRLAVEHAGRKVAAADARARLADAPLDADARSVLEAGLGIDWTAAARERRGVPVPESPEVATQTERDPRSYYDDALDLYERAVAACSAALDKYREAAKDLPPPEVPAPGPDGTVPPPPKREVVHGQWLDERVHILLRDEVRLAAKAQDEAERLLCRNISAGLGVTETDEHGVRHFVHPQWWKRGDKVLTPYSWDGRHETRDEQALMVATIVHAHAGQLATLVLTGDGGSMTREQHTFQWDDEADEPVDDGLGTVRFEEWGGTGIKVGGTIHPQSRGLVEIVQTG